jgi:hypothetical protein
MYQVPSLTLINYAQVLIYRKNKRMSGVMKAKIWTEKKYYWWTQDEPELPIMETRPYDYAALYVHVLVLQERDDYDIVRNEH